jgi:DNA polymerase-3 subunit gamma/tau
MAYQVLARKYRPQRFADVVGQDHVTVTLTNALVQNRIAHGYIFSGHRGIGKTTIARILAMALNCRNPIGSPARPTAEPCETCESCTEIRAGNAVDVIEIDAATNRGIDEIRELRDAARYAPSRDRYKIYILDEAHQITDAAFNALLKTLEEPPDHIVFMMATTQPEDLPQTIRSRCQHFSFHAVKLLDILGQLRSIAAAEEVIADESALSLLAEAGDGSMRDALSIMDQAIASAPIEPSADGTAGHARLDAAQIRELMGTVPNAVFERIFDAVNQNSSAEVMLAANQLLDAGNSAAQLARQCVRYLRNALIAKIANLSVDGESAEGVGNELLQISPDEQRRAARTAALFSEEELSRFLQVMLRTFDELGYRQEQRFHFELGLLKLVHLRRLLPVEELLSQIPIAKPGSPSMTGSHPGMGGKTTSKPGAPSTTSSGAPSMPESHPGMGGRSTPAPARPAFSPFQQDNSRRRPEGTASTISALIPVSAAGAPSMPESHPGMGGLRPSSATAPTPIPETRGANAVAARPATESLPIPTPAPVLLPESMPLTAPSRVEDRIEHQPDVALPTPVFETTAALASPFAPLAAAMPAPESPALNSDAAAMAQHAVVEALTAATQTSAAEAFADAAWTIANNEARVQTTLSKTMFPVVINPDAEKIARAALRDAGIHKLTLLPAAATHVAAKKSRPARIVSVQAKALEHPMVQQAQKLFAAELQTVIDLREPD